MSCRVRAFFAGHRAGRLYGRWGRILRPVWRGKGYLRSWDSGFRQGRYACWWCGS